MPLRLPDELLISIFQILQEWNGDEGAFPRLGRQGVQTLGRLCQTSRHFRAIAEPILYSAYYKVDTAMAGHKQYELASRSFLRTLVDRPDLAGQVQTLVVEPWLADLRQVGSYVHDRLGNVLLSVPDAIALQLAEVASKIPIPSVRCITHADWQAALLSGDQDAEVALLLALLPNVETLYITFPYELVDDHDHHFRAVLERTVGSDELDENEVAANKWTNKSGSTLIDQDCDSGNPGNLLSDCRPLARLKHLRITVCDRPNAPWAGLSTYYLTELIQLPSLESVSLYSIRDLEEIPCPPQSCFIQDLRFYETELSPEAIASFVHSCISLRRFDLKWRSGDTYVSLISFPSVRDALLAHRGSLDTLVLSMPSSKQIMEMYWNHGPGDIDVEPMEPIGSLRDFTALRFLRISQHGLMKESEPGGTEDYYFMPDMLPPTLEVLEIERVTPALTVQVQHMKAQRAQFPRLRAIIGHNQDGSEVDLWAEEVPGHVHM